MKDHLPKEAAFTPIENSMGKDQIVHFIRSIQEKHDTLLSDMKPPQDDYREYMNSIKQRLYKYSDNTTKAGVQEVRALLEQMVHRILDEYRAIEQKMLLREARFSSIKENAATCIGQLDEHGRLTDYNQHFHHLMSRISSQEISIGKDFIQCLQDTKLGQRCQQSINYCLMGQQKQLSEIVSRDGKSIILNLRFYPIMLHQEPVGVSLFIEDLTQKHQQESLFRLLNSAVISANDAIVVTQVNDGEIEDYPVIYANHAYATLSGFSEEEIIGCALKISNIENTGEDGLGRLKALMRSGEPGRIDMTNYRKDGSQYWVNVSLVPLKDEQDTITHWIAIQRDITEHKKAAQTIRKQKYFLESVNRNTTEAILCADANRKLNFSNLAFQKLFQYSTEEITLDKLFANIPTREKFEQMLHAQGRISNASFIFRRKDGSTFWGLASFSVNEYLGHKQYDGAVRDISDIKETEKILQEKNQALKKANEELDRFVYSASHDLRAPLASTLGLINITRISRDELEKQTYLNMMEQSLNKMDKTIQDITDYSRNARLQIESEEIYFESIIDDVLQRLKYLKHVDDVQVNTYIEGKEKFYTDKMRLYVILINLISNAIKYLRYDEAHPYINIRIQVNRQTARILVEDNGIGIDKEHLDKIFSMFFQAARESSGSGLGLFIVKETINKLKGSIQVRSEPKKGSCFEIILPNELQNEKT
jgi:PAS domain S-box-containing protein